MVGSQPVIVDFDESIFEPSAYSNGNGSVLERDDTGQSLKMKIGSLVFGTNKVAASKCEEFIGLAKSMARNPLVLVVGGGAIGAGTRRLYEDPALTVMGTDVYASAFTSLVADAHQLPIADASVDAVWIQAVLEHVLDPARVVAEIHRVLRPDGIVYAETPFMQQVHEGAYDFTRFTLSGHRWLFRQFSEVASGQVGGPGGAAVWSMRYLFRALGLPDPIATGLALPFAPLHLLDTFTRGRNGEDAAGGVYFLGRRSETAMRPKDMVAFYEQRRSAHATA